MKRTLLALALIAAAAPLAAKEKPAPLSPGKYKDWGDFIDELEIVHSFKCADFPVLRIESLDTAATPLPDEGDKRRAFVKNVLASAREIVAGGIKDGLGDCKLKIEDAPAPVPSASGPAPAPAAEPLPDAAASAPGSSSGEARVLILRLTVTELNPGSKAARYWGGFGAGHSDAELSGELREPGGGVLLRFHVGRGSSGMTSAFGGNYEKLMTRDLHDAAESVGKLLGRFK